MKKKYLILSTLGLFMFSCKQHPVLKVASPYYQKENASDFTSTASFKYTDCLTLKADSDVTSELTNVDYYIDKNTKREYLSFLSPVTKSILIYDFNQKTIAKKVPLYNAGKNKTGRIISPSSISMISKDSIAYFNFDHLFILDTLGNKLKSVELHSPPKKEYDFLNDTEARPCPGTYSPIISAGNSIYVMSGYNSLVTDQTKVRDVLKVDIANKKVNPVVNRPEIYNYGYWGYNENLYKLYGNFNPQTRQIIFSYPADPFLYSYNVDNGKVLKERFAGSKFFKQIEPYKTEHEVAMPPISDDIMQQSAEHEIRNPSYYSLLYDATNNIYIRIAFLPLTKAEYNNPLTRYKFRCTFIILDNKFKKIGEQIIGNGTDVDYHLMFVQNGYLHIFNKSKYRKNNNQLPFDRYKIELKS